MADKTTVVVYSEIEKHRAIWAAQGPRLGDGVQGELGIAKQLGQSSFSKTPTFAFSAAQDGHNQVLATMVARCAEGAEVWSMIEQVLRIAVLKYRGAEAEAVDLVRQLERRLPR